MNDEQPATPQPAEPEVWRYMRPGGEWFYTDYHDPADPDCENGQPLYAATPQQPAAASAGAAHAALAELVAVKDLKDRTEAIGFAGPAGTFGDGWQAIYDSGRKEYLRRQPLAWDAARAALQSPPVATAQQSEPAPTPLTNPHNWFPALHAIVEVWADQGHYVPGALDKMIANASEEIEAWQAIYGQATAQQSEAICRVRSAEVSGPVYCGDSGVYCNECPARAHPAAGEATEPKCSYCAGQGETFHERPCSFCSGSGVSATERGAS